MDNKPLASKATAITAKRIMKAPWTKAIEKAKAEGFRQGQIETARSAFGAVQLPAVPGTNGLATAQHPLYAFDNPYRYTVPQAPRRKPDSFVTIEVLRHMADSYDVLRSCIEQIKREVVRTPIKVKSRDGSKNEARIAEGQRLFDSAGPIGGIGRRRAHFEREVIEDTLVIGANAIYCSGTKGGRIYEALAIDASTIRPNVDAFGWVDDSKAFEQWVQGLYVRSFARSELIYDGLAPRSYSPYFVSPVEWLAATVLSAIKADEWNRTWLTDGTTVSDLLAMPMEWTPDMIRDFYQFFSEMNSGNAVERQKMKMVPGGSQKVGSNSRKDQDFQEYEMWLLRRTCSIMGMQPASIGYVGEQYKVTQGDSMDHSSVYGVGAILEMLKATYDYLLGRLGYPDLEMIFVPDEEDRKQKVSTRLVAECGGPIKSPNEGREELGYPPIEGGDTLRNAQTEPDPNETKDEALGKFEKKAGNRLKSGKAARCEFSHPELPQGMVTEINLLLETAKTFTDVRRVFNHYRSSPLPT